MNLFDTERNDLSAGQIVVVIARWLLIATGFAITLWSPVETDLEAIKVTIGALFLVAIGNFFIHARLLMRQPVPPNVAYGTSAVDVAVITLVVWAFGGTNNPIFVFYYTAILALALVFPLGITATLVAVAMGAYAAVSVSGHMTEADLQSLVLRLVSLAAIAVIGSMYQHIERNRREANRRPAPKSRATEILPV